MFNSINPQYRFQNPQILIQKNRQAAFAGESIKPADKFIADSFKEILLKELNGEEEKAANIMKNFTSRIFATKKEIYYPLAAEINNNADSLFANHISQINSAMNQRKPH